MLVYAGIDEAGYGPMFGPLVVGRTVLAVSDAPSSDAQPPAGTDLGAAPVDLWKRLSRVVCRSLSGRKDRIAINDSKKLHTRSSGIRHLEVGVLAFASAAGVRPATVDRWLDALGEKRHHDLLGLPWYAGCSTRPWAALPCAMTLGEVAIARSMLARETDANGVKVLDIGGAVVFEDDFNRMVAATRSKAATSFTFVGRHLRSVWDRFGASNPLVIVDRQSGRVHYRELLALSFPDAVLRIVEETAERSTYELRDNSDREAGDRRFMRVSFQVEAERQHMPVALASMLAKYSRELLMARFQTYFAERCPEIKPTAGYGADAKRFWREIEPRLTELRIEANVLRRQS